MIYESSVLVSPEKAAAQILHYKKPNGCFRTNIEGSHLTNKVYDIFKGIKHRVGKAGQGTSYAEVVLDDFLYDYDIFAEFILSKFDLDVISEYELQIDKDLFGQMQDRKSCYSKATITFIPRELNSFLVSGRVTNKTGYTGVSYSKANAKYLASLKIDGKPNFLGYFSCPKEASVIYCIAKLEQALIWSERIKTLNPEASNALKQIKASIFAQ